MATSTLRTAWRQLVAMLVIVLALLGAMFATTAWSNGEWTPKLGLDLEGGTQMILQPQVRAGQSVNDEQLSQAVDIMRARVDGQGVSEAEVSTQGDRNIIVEIPGQNRSDLVDSVKRTAQLRFRLVAGQPQPGQAPPPASPAPPARSKPCSTNSPPPTASTAAAATASPASSTRPPPRPPPEPFHPSATSPTRRCAASTPGSAT